MKTIKKLITVVVLMIFSICNISVNAQERVKPTWWFGVAGGGNFNFYRGTAQILNNSLTTDYAFEDGFGVAPYISVFAEWRPDPVWGLMLNVAYDGHRGQFDRIEGPPGFSTSLNAEFDYIAFEPSLRIAPFKGNFYIFLGPRLSYNIYDKFIYQVASEPYQTNEEAKWSDVYGIRLSAQIGIGYDIMLSPPANRTQWAISPFVSFLPYFGEQPRSIENLTLTTVRAGIALKFGCGPKPAVVHTAEVAPAPAPPAEKDVLFSVQAPESVPGQHVVMETLPLSDYIFFDAGNTQIPSRYIQLSKDQANNFTEAQLQDCQKIPDTRSTRQLKMYYNVLNIVADRMRKYPNSTIKLIGASAGKGAKIGKENAQSVKDYFVNNFGIDESRITVEGKNMPVIPSEEYPNSSIDTDLTRVEDNRVDIVSASTDLMMETMDNTALCLKPIQVTAMDGKAAGDAPITVNVVGANDALASWSVDVKDETGAVQHFGPYTGEKQTISGAAVLKDNPNGNYTIVMTGFTKSGNTITKESSFSLKREVAPVQHEQLTSILFEFDKSKTVATYTNFLDNVVAPVIPSNATVIISGHTDVVGSADYNLNLSVARAKEAQGILDTELKKEGKTGIIYQTNGYGEDNPPFANTLPEQRFYNRTVSIDIIPANNIATQK